MHDRIEEAERVDATAAAARDWVVRLAAADLSTAEMERFKAWLRRSAAHRAAFDRERRFWHRLGGLQAAAAESAAPAPPACAARPWRRPLLAAGLAAACIALVILFGGQLALSLRADYRTAEGEQLAVPLPDGSTAHLNTDSAIAIAFGGTERRVELLRGEVLFEVRPEAARPFRVAAAEGVSEAVGTAYLVRTLGDAARVTVTEGRVRVTSPAGAVGAAASVGLAAGERTSYRTGAAPRPPVPADAAKTAAWRRGLIVIDDLPLNEALAELDRYRPGRIVLVGGGSYGSVSGAFDTGNIDAAIAGLAATHGLRVTAITDFLVILR